MSTQSITLSRSFALRRIHSLFGLWIVIFLVEHLLTNSQAALLIGESGEGFIRAVNLIKNLPYLHVIEITLLGVPILYHMVLGVRYLLTSGMNAYSSGGNKPALSSYGRNHAYSWQRITSWILLIGLMAHVSYMRFYMYPVEVDAGREQTYFVRITMDPGLYTVSDRLGVKLYNREKIDRLERHVKSHAAELEKLTKEANAIEGRGANHYSQVTGELLKRYRSLERQKAYLKGLEKRKIGGNEIIAAAPDFGTATLLIVRDSFKSISKSILYTIFVLAAVFHGFNGLWTFMMTWGIVLKMRSQSTAVNVCIALMVLVGFLGLVAVWGTYFVNLRN